MCPSALGPEGNLINVAGVEYLLDVKSRRAPELAEVKPRRIRIVVRGGQICAVAYRVHIVQGFLPGEGDQERQISRSALVESQTQTVVPRTVLVIIVLNV